MAEWIIILIGIDNNNGTDQDYVKTTYLSLSHLISQHYRKTQL